MRITRLRIKNFRSIQDLDIQVPQICAVVGPNNAGKSNILEALKRVLGGGWVNVNTFSIDDIHYRNPESDIEIWCTVAPPILYRKIKQADETEVHTLYYKFTKYKIGEKKGEPRLEQKCLDADDKEIKVLAKRPRKGESHQYEPLVNIPAEVRDAVPLIHIGTNRSLREQLPGARFSLLRRMFEDINRNLQDPSETVQVPGADGVREMPRLDRFRELMEQAMELLRTERFLEIERSIKRNALRQLGLDPLADTDALDLCFTPMDTFDFYRSLDLLVTEGGFSISAREMGEGVQNAIVLAILQAFEETRRQGAILLIEEPEMFLHPQMQRSLYRTLREIGRKNQVVYTTHSPHFVSMPEYDEAMLVRKSGGSTVVRFSDLPVDARRREKLIKELDPERGEMFFSRRLLLVEGDTEKLALPAYAERLGLDLDREGATIVEVGGKRNLRDFAQIAISFSIPTGIVYDRDSSDFANREEEEAFNSELDGMAVEDGSVRVWRFDRTYEDELRQALGEESFQALCGKIGRTGKPIRARLIALEDGSAIPSKVEEIVRWMAGSPGPRGLG